MLETVRFAELHVTWGHESTLVLVLPLTPISAITTDPEAHAFVSAVVQVTDLRVLEVGPGVFRAQQQQREALARFHLHVRGGLTTLRPIAEGVSELVAVDRVQVLCLNRPAVGWDPTSRQS